MGWGKFFSLLPFVLLAGIFAAALGKLFSVFHKKIQLKKEVRDAIRRIHSLAGAYTESWMFE